MGQLRREGAIFFSTEVVQVLSLITGFVVLRYISVYLFDDMRLVLRKCFSLIASREEFSIKFIQTGIFDITILVMPHLLILTFSVAIVASYAVLHQTKWNIKEKKFDFKFFNINPIQGIKKIVSINGFINTLKAILKLCLI